MNLSMITLDDSAIQKNRCFSGNIAEKDLADLAFNGLRSDIKERLEGYDFFTVTQVHQKSFGCRKPKQRVSRIL